MALLDRLPRLRLRDDVRLLEPVLTAADASAPLVERMEWLADLISWVRGPPLTGGSPLTRLQFLVQRLERHDADRARVRATLQALVEEVRAVDLLASAGVPARFDFFGELGERVRRHILPTPLVVDDFAEVVSVLFSSEEDAVWVAAIDAELLGRITSVIGPETCIQLKQDAESAVQVLAALVDGEANDVEIRRRLAGEHAPVLIGAAIERDPSQAKDAILQLRARVEQAISDLDEEGTSIALTYRLDRLLARLQRLRRLLPAVTDDEDLDVTAVLAVIIREGLAVTRVRGLFGQGTHLLARKVVDHAAEVGRHYIAATRSEYWALFRAALGGGVIMGICTIVKMLLVSLKLPHIYEGIFAGLNYAVGFAVVQMLGFTVATKQPASTAPALAAALADRDAQRSFAPEVARLIRCQIAAIAGNLLTVAPSAILLDLALAKLLGHHAMSAEKAEASLASLSLLGPTPLFAAWTGILLFAAALLSGLSANWLAYHRVRRALGTNRVARRVLGARRATKLAAWAVGALPGFLGNVSFGMWLGFLPAVALVFRLPFDIRHVTVSSGSVALACLTTPPTLTTLLPVLLAVAGTLATGFFNVVVSFSFAMLVAVRANTVHAPWSELLSATLRHLTFHTRDFVLPPR